eukprot:gene12142-biopygen5617
MNAYMLSEQRSCTKPWKTLADWRTGGPWLADLGGLLWWTSGRLLVDFWRSGGLLAGFWRDSQSASHFSQLSCHPTRESEQLIVNGEFSALVSTCEGQNSQFSSGGLLATSGGLLTDSGRLWRSGGQAWFWRTLADSGGLADLLADDGGLWQNSGGLAGGL